MLVNYYFKQTTHEGGIRVPLVLSWPKGIAARGEMRHQFAGVADIAPTILDLAGVPLAKTINKRFKDWGILFQRFRHDVRLHRDVFAAIAVLCQLTIQLVEPLFPVNYDDEVMEG